MICSACVTNGRSWQSLKTKMPLSSSEVLLLHSTNPLHRVHSAIRCTLLSVAHLAKATSLFRKSTTLGLCCVDFCAEKGCAACVLLRVHSCSSGRCLSADRREKRLQLAIRWMGN